MTLAITEVAERTRDLLAAITVTASDGGSPATTVANVLSFTISADDDAPTLKPGASPIALRASVDEAFSPFAVDPSLYFVDDGGAVNLLLTIEGFDPTEDNKGVTGVAVNADKEIIVSGMFDEQATLTLTLVAYDQGGVSARTDDGGGSVRSPSPSSPPLPSLR